MKLFQIPTIQEIFDFIIYKQPAWPGSFVQWYSEKFYNHYKSSGWKLSSGVALKDWKAAFCSNWKELKWEAKEKLAELQQLEIQKPNKGVDQMSFRYFVNELLDDFRKGKIDRKQMASCYKWLKANGMTFTKEETEKLVSDAGNDKEYGRYLSVKLYFTKLINQENDKSGSNAVSGHKTGGTV